jgi:hypothetical protein
LILQASAQPSQTGGVAGSGQRSSVCQGALTMNSIVYLVGLVVIVMFILSFIGLR